MGSKVIPRCEYQIKSGFQSSVRGRAKARNLPQVRGVAPLSSIPKVNTINTIKLINSINLFKAFARLMTYLERNDKRLRFDALRAITILLEAGLVDREIVKERIPALLEKFVLDLDYGDSFKCNESIMAIKILVEEGLVDRETVDGEQLLDKLVQGLGADTISVHISAAKTIKILVEAGLINREAVKRKIAQRLDKFFQNIEAVSELAKSTIALIDADLIGKETIAKRHLLDRLIQGLEADKMHLRIGPAEAIKALVEASLVDREIIKERIAHQIDKLVQDLESRSLELRLGSAGAIKFLVEAGLIERKEQLLDKLIRGLEDGNVYMRMRSAEAIKALVEAGLVNREIIKEKIAHQVDNFIQGLEDSRWFLRAGSAQTIRILIEGGLVKKETAILDKLVQCAGENEKYVNIRSSEAIKALVEAGLVDKETARKRTAHLLNRFIQKLGYDWIMPVESAEAIKALFEAGLFEFYEAREIIQLYQKLGFAPLSDLQKGLLIKAHSILKGKIEGKDVKYLGHLIDKTDNPEMLEELLEVMAYFTHKGSNDAQVYLERGIEMIFGKEKDKKTGYIDITPRERLIIEYALKSSHPESLLPFIFREDIELEMRVLYIGRLAKTGVIDGTYVKYLDGLINKMDNPESLERLLDVVVYFTHKGSNDAQVYLERKIEAILGKEKNKEAKYIDITPEERLIIEYTLKSSRQMSLIPFSLREDIEPGIRVFCISELAETGVIDSSYLDIFTPELLSKEEERYLRIIAAVHRKLTNKTIPNFMPPAALVRMIRQGEITLNQLEDLLQDIKDLEDKGDLHSLIKGISAREDLLITYYCFRQAPFDYPGTTTLSYDRFKATIQRAVDKIELFDERIVGKKLKAAFVKAGMSGAEASELCESLNRGGVPLPKGSKYLDEQGRFIPQEINILSRIQASEQIQHAQSSFNFALENIVRIFKINALIKGITKAIDKYKWARKAKGNLNEIKTAFTSLNIGDLGEIHESLLQLNNRIFTRQQTPIDRILGNRLRTATRRALKGEFGAVGTIFDKRKGKSDLTFFLLDIHQLFKSMEGLIKTFEEKQSKQQLSPAEIIIFAGHGIVPRSILRLFFHKIFSDKDRIRVKALRGAFEECLGNLVESYVNYASFMGREISPLSEVTLYLDYLDKRNLFEILRFADGAHCCNSSDPKVNARYLAEVYEPNAHRWVLDTTTFFFQLSTEPKGGKQVGWLKAWFGIDENFLPFVGSNYLYLGPSYQSEQLGRAVWERIEEVLFSIPVSMIAQTDARHLPTNSIIPPPDYAKEDLKFVRLQSLDDGTPIQTDVKIQGNVERSITFYIKERKTDLL